MAAIIVLSIPFVYLIIVSIILGKDELRRARIKRIKKQNHPNAIRSQMKYWKVGDEISSRIKPCSGKLKAWDGFSFTFENKDYDEVYTFTINNMPIDIRNYGYRERIREVDLKNKKKKNKEKIDLEKRFSKDYMELCKQFQEEVGELWKG